MKRELRKLGVKTDAKGFATETAANLLKLRAVHDELVTKVDAVEIGLSGDRERLEKLKDIQRRHAAGLITDEQAKTEIAALKA